MNVYDTLLVFWTLLGICAVFGPRRKEMMNRQVSEVLDNHDNQGEQGHDYADGPLCKECGCTQVNAEISGLAVESASRYSPGGVDYDEDGIRCYKCGWEYPHELQGEFLSKLVFPFSFFRPYAWTTAAYEQAVVDAMDDAAHGYEEA